jgi:hypothetical protein
MENLFSIDMIGYLALSINLYSMSVKGEQKLRIISGVANACFIIYGSMIGALPIVIGSTIAVCLHSYHIVRISKEKGKV